MQLKHARAYIEEKIDGVNPNDLVMFAGDFNCNGPTLKKGAKNYIEHLQGRVSRMLECKWL